jgi:protein-tyrosine phosphatase
MEKLRVLMVCMGNICRSPTAEAVLRHKLRERGLDGLVEVDSAGTHGWHAGAPPDARSQVHASRRGYDLSALRARSLVAADFDRFDLVLVMDDENLAHARAACPPAAWSRVRRLMSYAGEGAPQEVPDPYSGGTEGFERVLDLIEQACEGLLADLSKRVERSGNFTG